MSHFPRLQTLWLSRSGTGLRLLREVHGSDARGQGTDRRAASLPSHPQVYHNLPDQKSRIRFRAEYNTRRRLPPDERGVKVRDAAQFGTGVGLGPRYGFWARYNLGLAGPLLPSGGTWQAVESSCVPVSAPGRYSPGPGMDELLE